MKRLIVVSLALALAACGKGGNQNTDGGGGAIVDGGDALEIVELVEFSPRGGIYTTAQQVTLSCRTTGAAIYFTTDGTPPTKASTRYTAPIAVSAYRVIKAMATAPGYADSEVWSETYAFDTPVVATEAPTFSVAAGAYASTQTVTISSATPGASIYYTADGSTPTASSTQYTAPVPVAHSQTLRAFAAAPGKTPSSITSASYVIGGTATFMATCSAFEAKFLALAASCYKANPLAVQWEFGASSCAATQKEIDKALVTYDAAKGATCAAAIASLTCDYVYRTAAIPAECSSMLTGKVAANGACYSTVDCASGSCTSEVDLACPGTCKPFAAAGAACANDTPCAPGLECFGDVCKAPSAVGGACPCRPGLWCDLDLATQTGTCKAALVAGASCNPRGNNTCAGGLICDPDTATCKAIAGDGDACIPSASAGGPAVCGQGYHCDPSAKKCVSDPTVGHACTAEVPCLAGYCDDITTPSAPVCKELVAKGGACTDAAQCASFSCTNGKCDADARCVAP